MCAVDPDALPVGEAPCGVAGGHDGGNAELPRDDRGVGRRAAGVDDHPRRTWKLRRPGRFVYGVTSTSPVQPVEVRHLGDDPGPGRWPCRGCRAFRSPTHPLPPHVDGSGCTTTGRSAAC
jgi:hypothetical protein